MLSRFSQSEPVDVKLKWRKWFRGFYKCTHCICRPSSSRCSVGYRNIRAHIVNIVQNRNFPPSFRYQIYLEDIKIQDASHSVTSTNTIVNRQVIVECSSCWSCVKDLKQRISRYTSSFPTMLIWVLEPIWSEYSHQFNRKDLLLEDIRRPIC